MVVGAFALEELSPELFVVLLPSLDPPPQAVSEIVSVAKANWVVIFVTFG
ncbi:hypothetical protein VIBNISOn1_1630007 [Vibrio nigripulchritudo SOn1]|uniref:Uncharacterized protein n=1 Tax=Vibrio nigripulchritudo SOn1 TaxID=1238450 RepID=A0AAV2VMU3_9VIBR|nr:hypothetical protein VIBNISOn1_1630007 [Vibrio nigripulchritudo SOn1]